MQTRVLSSLVLLLAVAVTGCTSNRAKVSGKVYVGDKVVTGGYVQFHSEKSKAVGVGTIQGDGSYTITDAPTGASRITVQPAPQMPRAGTPPRGVSPIVQGETGVTAPRAPGARVPDRYQKSESTNLAFTVQAGTNSHDIRMNP